MVVIQTTLQYFHGRLINIIGCTKQTLYYFIDHPMIELYPVYIECQHTCLIKVK